MESDPVILIRTGLAEEEELTSATDVFGKANVFTSRTKLSLAKPGAMVVGRYSCLPWYKELEEDLEATGCHLINTHRQHAYVADLRNWYDDLESLTPKTWFELSAVPKDGGPFVLKGETNSAKFLFDTHMYAANYTAATEVYSRLSKDNLIGQQDIYIRQYEPLVKLADGLHGLKITEEYRFFVYRRKVICGGYYWASHVDDLETVRVPDPNVVPQKFLEEVIDRIQDQCNFYTIDVARKQDGTWIVIELNDGCQAGLSCIPSKTFYESLYKAIKA